MPQATTGILGNSPAASIAVPGILPSVATRSLYGNVQRINPTQDANWDRLLALHPGRSFFHKAAWAKVLEEAYGFVPSYFTVVRNGEVQSMLPIMEVDSRLTGRRGVALPFTDDCEPLCSDDKSSGELVKSVMAFGRSRGWKYLEFKGGRKLLNGSPASLLYYGHRLNLVEDEDLMFSRLASSVRRAIRKAKKSGLTVEISNGLDAMRVFHGLQCETRKKHGLPPQSFDFFRNIQQHVLSQNLGVTVVARHQGRPVAAAIHFHDGPLAVYKYGASNRTFQHLRGNNLVMWEAIKWHARNGSTVLDLGRASLGNQGLRRFKLGWGAEERLIEYFKYDLRGNRFITDTDESSGWHNRLFKALPSVISRAIGAVLYRHWA